MQLTCRKSRLAWKHFLSRECSKLPIIICLANRDPQRKPSTPWSLISLLALNKGRGKAEFLVCGFALMSTRTCRKPATYHITTLGASLKRSLKPPWQLSRVLLFDPLLIHVEQRASSPRWKSLDWSPFPRIEGSQWDLPCVPDRTKHGEFSLQKIFGEAWTYFWLTWKYY